MNEWVHILVNYLKEGITWVHEERVSWNKGNDRLFSMKKGFLSYQVILGVFK